jgi:LysR family hydrogen peroxide-inducible transcriptional activator
MTDHAVSACEIAYQEQVNALSASSIHTLLQMSQHHQGFTFIPELAKRQGILNNTGLTTLPSDGDAYREIALVWRNTSQRADLFNSIASILIPLMPVPNI